MAEPLSSLERDDNRALRTKHHKITFRITDDKRNYDYDMVLMPETYTLDRPARTTIVQTRGGAFIDDFGLGIGTLSIAGTTGFGQAKNNSPFFNSTSPTPLPTVDGADRWRGLVNFFDTWYRWKATDDEQLWHMHFYNWSERDYFRVHPMGLPRLMRNVRESLLFRYDIQLSVLRNLSKTDYSRGKLSGDVAEDLGTRTDRAPLIGLRMEEQLQNQAILIGHILSNQDIGEFDPNDPLTNLFGELPDDLQDAACQGFIDALIRRQAPANYTVPTDSQSGTVGRTRDLVTRINDYSQGKTAKIDATIGEVQATVRGWRDVLDAAEYAVNLPVVYAREVRETLCSVQSLLLYPQLFVNSVTAALTELADLLLDSGCATTLQR